MPQRTFDRPGHARWASCRPTAAERGALPGARCGGRTRTALLKPDMTAYARVLTDPASAATRLFRGAGALGAAHLVEDLVMRRASCAAARGRCRGGQTLRRGKDAAGRPAPAAAPPPPAGRARDGGYGHGRRAALASRPALRRARRRRCSPASPGVVESLLVDLGRARSRRDSSCATLENTDQDDRPRPGAARARERQESGRAAAGAQDRGRGDARRIRSRWSSSTARPSSRSARPSATRTSRESRRRSMA